MYMDINVKFVAVLAKLSKVVSNKYLLLQYHFLKEITQIITSFFTLWQGYCKQPRHSHYSHSPSGQSVSDIKYEQELTIYSGMRKSKLLTFKQSPRQIHCLKALQQNTI